MANKELVDYLLSIREYSYPEETVVNVLHEAGWPDREIEDAFNVVHGLEQKPSYAWLKASTVLVLLVMAFVFGIATDFTNNITGNIAGARQEAVLTLKQTEPTMSSYEISVLEEVEVPAVPEEPAIVQQEVQPKMPSLSECEKISNSAERDKCLEYYALERNDDELCGRIRNSEMYVSCMQHLAIELKDRKLCQRLNDAENCLKMVAQQTGDVTVCAGISNPEKREACYGSA